MHRAALWLQEVLVPMLGPWGLFDVSFLDSSVLSLPEVPDILVVTASAARPEQAWLPATMATIGSVAGCCLLWWLAWHGGAPPLERLLGPARLRRAKRQFLRWHALALVVTRPCCRRPRLRTQRGQARREQPDALEKNLPRSLQTVPAVKSSDH